MKVVVCSKNKAKNEAVENVIKDFIKEYEIISLNTNSNVSETPMSHEEGIEGAINRINDARNQVDDANLYIAMEGIINKVKNETFLCGWTVMYDKETDKYLYGCSAQIHVPSKIIDNLSKDERLSDVVAKMYDKDELDVRDYGTNGILTNGCYTRVDEFTDSVLCAISSQYNKLD